MKLVPLREEGQVITVEVLRNIVDSLPAGQTIAQLRARERIAKSLEKAGGTELLMEDSDYDELVKIVNQTAWVPPPGTRSALLNVIDDVLNAKAPPEPEVKSAA